MTCALVLSTVCLLLYLLAMRCSTIIRDQRAKNQLSLFVGVIQLIISCCLACTALLWTIDLIELWKFNSYINEVDSLSPG